MFLDSGIALRVAIDSNGAFFGIFIVFIVHIIIDEVKNQFFHIQAVFFLESEYTLVVEKESQRTCRTQVSTELIKYRTHIGYGTGRVISQGIYEDSHPMRPCPSACFHAYKSR